VPSYWVGHQIGENLARSTGSWINLRMTTVAGYAQELVSADLGREGIRLVTSHEKFLILEEIFKESEILGGVDRYFEAAVDKPGIIRCLGNTIDELRMAGVRVEDIDSRAFIVPEKGEEILRLLEMYEAFLLENRLIDRVGLVTMAIEKLNDMAKPVGSRVVMVLSDFPLTAVEKQLIGIVGGDNLEVIRHSKPVALETPRRFYEAPGTKEEAFESNSDIHLLRWLFRSGDGPAPFNDGTVSLYHALGESNEVREVFRRILGQGICLDDVEIVVTRNEPYVTLIHEIASSLDIPVTFSMGIPITYTRPGRALILYLKWQSESFLAAHLRRLFSGGYLDADTLDQDEEKPSPRKAAAIIRDARIGWGRERYTSRLSALEESYLARAAAWREEGEEEKAEAAEKEAARVAWVSKFIKKILFSIGHKDPEETVTLADVCKAAIAFLERFFRTAGELDGGARTKLVEVLRSLSQTPSASNTAKYILERIIGIVKETFIGYSNPKPGHVHVSHYFSGGYSGRTNTFVLGLDQAKFPEALLQDPVILDGEREKVSSKLPLAKDLLEESIYCMAKMLCSLKGMLVLSYSCRDLREDRDLFPASILCGKVGRP